MTSVSPARLVRQEFGQEPKEILTLIRSDGSELNVELGDNYKLDQLVELVKRVVDFTNVASVSKRQVISHLDTANRVSPNITADAKRLYPKIISYTDLKNGDPTEIAKILNALQEDGVIGISGTPDFEKASQQFISTATEFFGRPNLGKEQFACLIGQPTGYRSQEKDNADESYYDYVGNHGFADLKGCSPKRANLNKPSLGVIGQMLFDVGEKVLKMAELPQESLDKINGLGRMAHYKSDTKAAISEKKLCHYGLLTVLLPPSYYDKSGCRISKEPEEAGIFVRRPGDMEYSKIVSDDPEMMWVLPGEFAQLASNGRMKATNYFMQKADERGVQSYTMAVDLNPDDQACIKSTDPLSQDSRYHETTGGNIRLDGWCKFADWRRNTLNR